MELTLLNSKNKNIRLKVLKLTSTIHKEINTNTDEEMRSITGEGVERENESRRKNISIVKDKKQNTN